MAECIVVTCLYIITKPESVSLDTLCALGNMYEPLHWWHGSLCMFLLGWKDQRMLL